MSDEHDQAVDAREEAIARYTYAAQTEEQARMEWEAAKRPLTTAGPRGNLVSHPLFDNMLKAEKHANILLREIKPKLPVGRPKGAQSAPDRQMPPRRTKLKVVGEGA